MILTDAAGRPIPRPELPQDPTSAQVTEWLRAICNYNDHVVTLANRAFDTQFRKSLK